MRVIILQRCIPHYRAPLFEALWERFGWSVVTSLAFPRTSFLHLYEEEREFIRRYPLRFPNPQNANRCIVPTGRILKETRADVVISELSLGMSSTYQLLAHRHLAHGPLVVFWSHGYNMGRGLGLRGLPYQLPRMAVGLLADGHAVYSDEGQDFLSRFIGSERIVVVRNTLALPPSFDSTPERSLGKPRLLFVGRLTPDKRVPVLVRVFRRLLREHPDAELTIIGDGPDLPAVRSVGGELIGRRLHLPGPVFDERELARCFRSADIAVFPGAVGLSVNHALLYGVPVIAFDRGADGPFHHPEIAYVVDQVTGRRVRPCSEDALLEAILEFLHECPDPRSAFRSRIEAFVTSRLTLDRMLEDFARLEMKLRRMVRTRGAGESA